jgi:hypothetical protein
MNYRIYFFITIILIINVEGFSQKMVSDAVLNYSITIKNLETNQQVQFKNPLTYILYLKSNNSRSDFSNGLGLETTIYDMASSKGVILKEYSSQKLMINFSKENWLKMNQVFQQLNFKIDNNIVSVNNHQCKTAYAKNSTDETITVYFDDQINLTNKSYSLGFPNIPGLPVRITKTISGQEYEYNLVSLNLDAINTSIFEFPKTGFRVLTYEEAMNLSKKSGN